MPKLMPIALFAANFAKARAARFARQALRSEKTCILKHSTAPFIRRGKMACKA